MAKKKKEKEPEVFVKKEEIEEDFEKEKKVENDEPSWYHYIIVLGIFVGIFLFAYFGYNFYHSIQDNTEVDTGFNSARTYLYEHKVRNITYNLRFHYPVEEFDKVEYTYELSKLDLLNTREFIFSLDEYNGTDNGMVTVGTTFFISFLKTVYRFTFEEENFKKFENFTCENSTKSEKVVTYDPYSNETGIFYNKDNGCIQIKATNSEEAIFLTEKFVYEVVK